MEESMLTTVDNPYNPFTEYSEWYAFDWVHGYHTPSLLARITFTSYDLSETDQSQAIELAIDEIVRENASGVHRKVTPSTFEQLPKPTLMHSIDVVVD